MQVQGVPISPSKLNLPVTTPWADAIPLLSNDDMMELAGNSVRPMPAAQLTMFVLAACVPRRHQTTCKYTLIVTWIVEHICPTFFVLCHLVW